MLAEFEKKIAEFAKENELFGSAKRVLLAVSGGTDSTALIYAMQALKAEGILSCDFVCAHINHQLRAAEAEADENFAVAQARKLNLAITTKRLDVRGFARESKLSIETAARKLRIEGLLDIAKANNCKCIATAHQKNDNAETVIQRLARGTGFRGLGGIWPMRTFDDIRFVRPLLCVSRDEIIEYLQGRNLKWRKDRSNEDCKYRRNFIRHRLLPELQKECSNSVVEQLSELSRSARKFYSLVCGYADELWLEAADCSGDKVTLDLKKFSSHTKSIKVELIRRGLAWLGSGEKDLKQQHYERILQLTEQNVSGRKIELPDGFAVRREYGKLIFSRKRAEQIEKEKEKSKGIKVPGQTRFGKYLIDVTILETDVKQKSATEKLKTQNSKLKTVERFDLEKIKFPLKVRFRQDGDRFVPLGLAGEKKTGKFLTAAKVPWELRRNVLVVADSEKIIWVWPIRISEQAKITGETQKILQLQITDSR